MSLEVRAIEAADSAWVRRFLLTQVGYVRVVSRGVLRHANELPGFIGWLGGRRQALLTYHSDGRQMEVVTLHAAVQGRGLGTALLAAATKLAASQGCRRIWLITTNDNIHALRFYQRRGFVIAAVHVGALAQSRQLKPEIPLIGAEGIPLRDEIELEKQLH